jgi:hypothetical protein
VSRLRAIGDGGGVQTTALLILAGQRIIDFPLAIFANTGDDSEHPDTLAYVRHIHRPYAELHGVEFVEVQKTIGGQPDTILGKIDRTAKSEVIPVRTAADGPPMSRSCTYDFKMMIVGAELKRRGAGPDARAILAQGITLDEIARASRKSQEWEELTFPFLAPIPGYSVRAFRRTDCERLIRQTPLPRSIAHALRDLGPEVMGRLVWPQLVASDFTTIPIPRKSSCWFCPFHTLDTWRDMRDNEPDLFERSCQLEEQISRKAGAPRYLTRHGIPLRRLLDDGTATLPLADDPLGLEMGCMSGACAL